VPGRFDDSTYLDAVRAVVGACDAHGKAAGILLYDRAVIARHLELGFRFIGLGSDLGFVAAGARGMVDAAKGR
jgi:4-hydroxy-2-oxoheptanedioate aldolase